MYVLLANFFSDMHIDIHVALTFENLDSHVYVCMRSKVSMNV
jgi:hypothetical protein